MTSRDPNYTSDSSKGSQDPPPEDAPAKANPFAPSSGSSKNISHTDLPEKYNLQAVQPPRLLPNEQQTIISKRPPISDSSLGGSTPMEMGRNLEGEQLGHFKLQEFVGGGGMGAVFRAEDTLLGRTVAVKVLSRDLSNAEETVRRFKNEAQSAARLNHENIARVYFEGEDKGWNYIVFEFIEGINIRDLVQQQGPLNLDEAIYYTLQIAEAIAHAARRDVVHRDIKPSNVLISSDGRAKLVDMGLARLHQVESSEQDLTASGVTLGTFDYISPEQARDPRSADVRSDLYSLGCTFYFMLAGRPPFPDGTVLQKLLSHSADDPPDPRESRPDLPEEITAITNKMLAKQPDQRYQEPSQLIGELLLLADRLGLRTAARGGTVWITPESSKTSLIERVYPWAIPLAVLVFVVFGLEILWRRSGDSSQRPPQFQVPADSERSTPRARAEADQYKLNKVSPSGEESGPKKPFPLPAPGADSENRIEPSPNLPGDVLPRGTAQFKVNRQSPLEKIIADSAALTGIGPEALGDSSQLAAAPPMSVSLSVADASGEAGRLAGSNHTSHVPRNTGAPASEHPFDIRVLIVAAKGQPLTPSPGQLIVETLEEAVRRVGQLPKLEAIELHFHGAREHLPFTVALSKPDAHLTIRGGPGFSPLIRFKPQVGDLAVYSMITVAGGQLTLENVGLQLDVPRQPVDHWALFELQNTEVLQLDHCTMTIVNATEGRATLHEDVAFIDIRPPPSRETTLPEQEAKFETPIVIELSDCIARGEATLVRAVETLPLRLSWDNGLLVTTERLLWTGGARMDGSQVGLSIELSHLTAIMDRGLCLMASSENTPHQLSVKIRCADSLLITDPGFPLIEQQGIDSIQWLRSRIFFSGMGNYYQDVKLMRRIQSAQDDGEVEQWDFKRWEQQWAQEKVPRWIANGVELPNVNIPVNRHTPEDYRLVDKPTNLARKGATDSSDAGALLEDLPPLPATSRRLEPVETTGSSSSLFGDD